MPPLPSPITRGRVLASALVLVAVLLAAASAAADERPRARTAIVGGVPAPAGEQPWMAAVLLGREGTVADRFNCGGSLIAPTIVLTAAHCAVDAENAPLAPTELEVVLGRERLLGAGGEEIAVSRVEVDPDYDPQRISHDIALLQLARPSTARPVALGHAKLGLREGQTGTVLGWGRTFKDGPISERLLAADIPLWSNARCGTRYGQQHDPGLMLCAATPRGGRDICQGDSGGPLLIRDRAGAVRLVGVTSFNIPCARPQLPSNFAWVASPHHLGWIIRRGNAMVRGDTDTTRPRLTGATAARGRLRYTLSEPAQVVFTVNEVRGRVALRYTTALVQNGRAGTNTVRVPRTLRGTRVRPGRYVLEAVATDHAGNRGAPVLTRVTVR